MWHGHSVMISLHISIFKSKNQCCGLLNGPSDWGKNIGNSKTCECEVKSSSDLCTYYQGRYVYKNPCGDVIINYLKDHLLIIMGIAFGLAVIESVKSSSLAIVTHQRDSSFFSCINLCKIGKDWPIPLMKTK
ncbi:hypothetical protein AAES_133351 [Amazona aestiva]|uniref:Uncharacterized protein n=1 Tax=Amazona aestiva TaxID=12930 RepID=A0A0Q3T7Z1_AMAAE|nr:hypothetical protein AAES_133351 [Amazona aestiva]